MQVKRPGTTSEACLFSEMTSGRRGNIPGTFPDLKLHKQQHSSCPYRSLSRSTPSLGRLQPLPLNNIGQLLEEGRGVEFESPLLAVCARGFAPGERAGGVVRG